MFGPFLRVSHEGITVVLSPFSRDDMPVAAKGLSSLEVTMYTNQLFGQTLESEQQWYDKQNSSSDSVIWRISLEGEDTPIGTTGLHGITHPAHTCTSGIIIWDRSKWGKGVASRAHLARTLFAADFLDRYTIRSSVRTDNLASLRALEKVGYTRTGMDPKSGFRAGKFLDTHILSWFNPARVHLLYPEGVPEEYQVGLRRAEAALALGREVVTY